MCAATTTMVSAPARDVLNVKNRRMTCDASQATENVWVLTQDETIQICCNFYCWICLEGFIKSQVSPYVYCTVPVVQCNLRLWLCASRKPTVPKSLSGREATQLSPSFVKWIYLWGVLTYLCVCVCVYLCHVSTPPSSETVNYSSFSISGFILFRSNQCIDQTSMSLIWTRKPM